MVTTRHDLTDRGEIPFAETKFRLQLGDNLHVYTKEKTELLN
jgi:hypothetical protein